MSLMSRLRRVLSIVLLAMLFASAVLLVTPAPAHAIADPDSPPSVNAVYVYENVLEDGDLGVLIDYYLDYAVLPPTGETATEAYMAVFIDIDGTTQLAANAPYAFQDSGYHRGLIWIYFSAADVTLYSIDSADAALYSVRLTGNPLLTWVPGPTPATAAGIDQWVTVGDPSTVIAARVLFYADTLELLWSLDLVEETATGAALTTLGESYFTNAIPNLRLIAPNVFSSQEVDPNYIDISYNTAFGATAINGTATLVGGPTITLVPGVNTIDTGITVGTIIIDLADWTRGTIDDNTGTIAGTPIDLTPGTNTLTVVVAGTFDVDVDEVTTATIRDDAVSGTGFDLTALGTAFGMSRWQVSGLVWAMITLILCAAAYRGTRVEGDSGFSPEGGKAIMYVFTAAVIGGWLLGLLHPLVLALLIIACGGFIGYIIFFKSETLHKGFMFCMWMFIIVSMAGNFAASGTGSIVATRLTADLTAAATNTITVAGTDGFPNSGYVRIGDEIIGYPAKTATTFEETTVLAVTVNPLTRGSKDTTAAAHSSGAMVRTQETGFLNAAMDYRIARFSDSAGSMDFAVIPNLLDLIGQFFKMPLDFLGTDLAILSYIWLVVAVGMLVGFILAVFGGRRV